MSYPADSIFVLVDVTPAGDAASFRVALIGAASWIGSPVALVPGGAQSAVDAASAAGAHVVLTADADAEAVTVPLVDALRAAYTNLQPDAVLISNSIWCSHRSRNSSAPSAAPLRPFGPDARRRWPSVPKVSGVSREERFSRESAEAGVRGESASMTSRAAETHAFQVAAGE